MKKQRLWWALVAITALTFFEIAFYFVYIFKPIDRIAGRDLGAPRGIPSVSEVFMPIRLSQYIMHADESKTFYSERLNGFSEELKTLMLSGSSFVKISEASYTLAGTVEEIKALEDTEGSPLGYDITLKNLFGDKHIEHITFSEARSAQVSLRIVSQSNLSVEEKTFTDIKGGDYLAIKRSTNLLNPAETNMEIEILKSAD